MKVDVLPSGVDSRSAPFAAEHPMFAYDVPKPSAEVRDFLAKAETVVVVGIGGSTLPLRVFLDAAVLNDRVKIVDTVDPLVWNSVKDIKDAVFCVVSKSGETLEIKALLAEIISAGLLSKTLFVTDPSKGTLRKLAGELKVLTLEIPSDIGGRFTNFTVFHRALLERFQISFEPLLFRARAAVKNLKANPSVLEKLFQNMYETGPETLVLWAYGERLKGLAAWAQQALAESLGKKSPTGIRVGVFPVVLQGPQDQHSVLQLLADGPQRNALWFFRTAKKNSAPLGRKMPEELAAFEKIGLERGLEILAESTYRTFVERLESKETSQPLANWEIEEPLLEEVVEVVVTIQALVEYSATRLGITAFDQPGVERGKQIARSLL